MKDTNYSILPVSTKLYATGTKHIKDFIANGLNSEKNLIDFDFVREDKKDNFEYYITIRHDNTKENTLKNTDGLITIKRIDDLKNDDYYTTINIDENKLYIEILNRLIEDGKVDGDFDV